jgi:hypothetical protein
MKILTLEILKDIKLDITSSNTKSNSNKNNNYYKIKKIDLFNYEIILEKDKV